MFEVSVIIPVFNVAHFIEEAVQSALVQSEVGEIILIEDGSKDNSLEVCKKLSLEFEKVRLVTHPQGRNLGVCHSRNLGIRSAQYDFIAFLDADDWYLPNRFSKDSAMFKNPDVMAVYSLSAIRFPEGREELFGCNDNLIEMLGTNDLREVYCHIMRNDVILGHTNANTFRKEVFEKAGVFDTRLRLHEDTELWNRVSRKVLFHAGELDQPVSIARRHESNTISLRSRESQLRFLWVWVDNIGIKNLYPCEKENFAYLYSRAISNPIKSDFFRKVIFHISFRFFGIFKDRFIRHFYQSSKISYSE
ncbi:glycosyltransferase family 2 protein [Algoriphagus halophytocola]|uniref:glycosyltransferase family 2 protein n=1 Tax=Algoriphagus halophytocola TaxID=2991499 RepID=UPI0022DE51C2|nr:glycosyltransferase family 2 protein [Algoriphagus sp. TR-M9]WBL41304.1 glycosyltransferase family 2 protein [Algoriphagus sp. TR-M9]